MSKHFTLKTTDNAWLQANCLLWLILADNHVMA